ncbi:hypothetical protein Tco_0638609 [Tanacetum coccineum]
MFKVSTILEDDSAELVFGGANGFVNVSLSNSATCSFRSTFEELIGEFVALMFGEVLGEGASLSIEVEEEEALAISGGSRFVVKMEVDIALVVHMESYCNEQFIWSIIVMGMDKGADLSITCSSYSFSP